MKSSTSTDHLNSSAKSTDEVLVKVENIGKIFCRDLRKSLWYGLKDTTRDLFAWGRKPGTSAEERGGVQTSPTRSPEPRPLRQSEFWANQGISFELRRGECLGLIGHNGAGKTTLLKMLNGLIKPDFGKITMRGRVGALIALGAGFNPVLTGRENIYVNGSVLGISKNELKSNFDEIVSFAEIEEFIDTPVQSYSSGMQIRLGFSIAIMAKPDVLILDEVLAVGDAAFRAKSLERVSRLLKDSAVIFVSHQMNQVSRICERAIWLEAGRIKETGETKQILDLYTNSILDMEPKKETKKASGLLSISCANSVTTQFDNPLNLEFSITSRSSFQIKAIQVGFENQRGEVLAQSRTRINEKIPDSDINLSLSFEHINLCPGCYWINLNLFEDELYKYHISMIHKAMTLQIEGEGWHGAPYTPIMKAKIEEFRND